MIQSPPTTRPSAGANPASSSPAGRLRAAVLLLAVVVTGCGWLYQAPEVRIADVRVVGLGLAGGTAELDVEVDNPNRFALEVRSLEYVLEVSDDAETPRWDTLASGAGADTVRIEGGTLERITLRIPFRYEAVGVALRSWLAGGSIPYRVEGAVRAAGFGGQRDLPFRSEGRFTP